MPASDLAAEFAMAKYFLSKSREMNDRFTLHPNQVLLATTLEYLTLPDIRWSKLTVLDCHPKQGISFASFIRPGFNGCILLQLKNFGDKPFNITIGERMVKPELINPNVIRIPVSVSLKHFVLVEPKPSRTAAD